MKSALRKMGNSTGMILPKPVLDELGVGLGTEMHVVVENGRVVATPVVHGRHRGWAEAAQVIGDAEQDQASAEWLGFSNDDDDALAW
jgi:antitoxin MazE